MWTCYICSFALMLLNNIVSYHNQLYNLVFDFGAFALLVWCYKKHLARKKGVAVTVNVLDLRPVQVPLSLVWVIWWHQQVHLSQISCMHQKVILYTWRA